MQGEARLSTKIMREWKKRGVWCYKVHGGPMQLNGVPDISGVYKGLSIWCETKLAYNKLSPIQAHRIGEIRKAGGFVVVAYSVEEAVALLDHIDAFHTVGDCWDIRCEFTKQEETYEKV